MAALGWIDWTLLAILAVSVMVGMWRGLVFELMSLIGWVVAYVLAQMFSPQVAAQLPIGAPGSALNQGLAFVVTFIVVLIVWALLARLVQMAVHATPLTAVDRLFGAAFGALRGALVLLAIATLVAFTPAAHSQPWRESQGAAWLAVVLHGLKPVLPVEVARHLPG